jgi:glutamate racemase
MLSDADSPIVGICDWGIGGLGFYNLLRAARPDVDIVYIGDQGVPGYGKFDRAGLTARIRRVLDTFRRLEVGEVVVACNAASTVLNDARVEGVRTLGMIEPTLNALRAKPAGSIGVIGGGRTIRSGAYRRPLVEQNWRVRQRVAQPLSGLIEAGEAASPQTRRLLGQILAPLRGVDTLVLACTHYIVLEASIREELPAADFVDPATEAWRQFAPRLPAPSERTGTNLFFTTGSPDAMRRQAVAAFGVEAKVEEIVI